MWHVRTVLMRPLLTVGDNRKQSFGVFSPRPPNNSTLRITRVLSPIQSNPNDAVTLVRLHVVVGLVGACRCSCEGFVEESVRNRHTGGGVREHP